MGHSAGLRLTVLKDRTTVTLEELGVFLFESLENENKHHEDSWTWRMMDSYGKGTVNANEIRQFAHSCDLDYTHHHAQVFVDYFSDDIMTSSHVTSSCLPVLHRHYPPKEQEQVEINSKE